MTRTHYPVVVVGAGPTGMTVGTLLARYGIDTLILDRWDGIYPLPRAVHLDDEVYRIIARLGLADEFAGIARPASGLRLVNRDLTTLREFRREAANSPHGFPQANLFDQPEFEHILRTGLARHESVTIAGGRQVTGVAHTRGGARVDYIDRVSGTRGFVHADYVLGCDGANSIIRSAIGSQMQDLGFEQRWLVVDIATDRELGHWEGVHQVCDPVRAATYMRIGDSRHRWEFRLHDGETAGSFPTLESLHSLLSPWIENVDTGDLELIRVADYTFRAQIADRWRDRRVFLLGDAAHLTPPFIGQGMGAGIRDGANLAWKLAGVLDGTLPESSLDSYQLERKPHAAFMVRLALALGWAMTAGGELGHMARRQLVPLAVKVPSIGAKITTGVTPALRSSPFVHRRALRRGLSGTLCPNPVLADGLSVDDIAPDRFLVVTSGDPTDDQRFEIERRGACVVHAPPGSALGHWLDRGQATAAIVRPDRTVMAATRSLAGLYTALPTFTPDALPGGTR